jgi:hypothetical protein
MSRQSKVEPRYGLYMYEAGEGASEERIAHVANENAMAVESARIDAWHATFNAALTGLSPVVSIAEAIEQSTTIADRVHGCLQQ